MSKCTKENCPMQVGVECKLEECPYKTGSVSKYINAKDLRNAMYHEAFEKESKMQKWESGCWIRYKLFENVLDAMPSADVRENKHGEWIETSKNLSACSSCGNCILSEYTEDCFFCPNCGADMRGETE